MTFWIFEFELQIWYFNSELFNWKFKILFDLKAEIGIPNYYSGLSKLIFQDRKLLIECENGHFNSEICYSTSKTLCDPKIDIWILNCCFGI